jgi:hypothetical protein
MSASVWPIESSEKSWGKISGCEIRWAQPGADSNEVCEGGHNKATERLLCRHGIACALT